MARRKFTFDEVKNFVEVESDSGCKLLSKEYINALEKISIQCSCEKEFLTTFNYFKRGKNKCNECSWSNTGKALKHDYSYVKNYIEIESKSGCKLLSDTYSSNKIKIKIECLCGNIFYTPFDKFKNQGKTKCNACSNLPRKNTEIFKQEVSDLVENEYTVLGEYVNGHSKILIKHNSCDYEYEVTPASFLRGTRCPLCQHRSYIRTTEEFKSDVYNIVKDEYVVVSEYTGTDNKILLLHNTCGNTISMTPNAFLNKNTRCCICAESRGESEIRRYLDGNSIKFIPEYSFTDLTGVGGGLLRFDFAILNKNKINPILLIEYDGEFHFEKQYENDHFEDLQIHDKRKNQYCKDNNIPLIRIPYWQFDKIEQILDKWLNKYGLIHNEDIKEIA